ncbi:LamG domain-containing protein [Bacteroidota bacterium]
MKTKSTFVLLFLFIVCSCSTFNVGNDEAAKISKDNLVLYLPFSGSIDDESKIDNQFQLVGVSLSDDRHGKINSACLFNGIDNHLVIKDSDFLFPSNNKLSISLWAKIAYPGNKFLLYKGSSLYDREYALGINEDSLFTFQINHNGSSTERSAINSGTVIKEDEWYHLVGTWDGKVQKLYLNGSLVNIDYPNISIGNFNSALYIGSFGGSIKQYAFKGVIDDLLIYNRVLNEKEVQVLYKYDINFK